MPFESCETAVDAIDGADALLIVTEWPEFKALNWKTIKSKMKTPLVFDGRNLYDPMKMKEFGVEYYGIGRQIRGTRATT